VNCTVAPDEGTLMGNVADVVRPEGSVPSVIEGVALVPVSVASTVTEKDTPGLIVATLGVAFIDKVGFEPPAPPPAFPPPPHPHTDVRVKIMAHDIPISESFGREARIRPRRAISLERFLSARGRLNKATEQA